MKGWISKTVLDELGNGIMVPENGSHAHTPRRVRLNPLEKIDVWATVCRRGFLQRVDRSRVPQNLRSPTEEELAEKSHRLRRRDQTTIRRVSEGEEIDRKETRSPKKKKKRFSPLALIPRGKRKKRRILNLLFSKKEKNYLTYWTYIHTHTDTHMLVRPTIYK